MDFEDHGTWFKVVLRKTTAADEEPTGNASQKTPQKTPQKILAAIYENPFVSTQEMADMFGVERSTVARAVAKLKASGKLRRVGPDKGGHWEATGK